MRIREFFVNYFERSNQEDDSVHDVVCKTDKFRIDSAKKSVVLKRT